jgi:hypothetical protein
MEFSTVIGSAVVAAIVSGVVAWRTAERQIQIQNITQERAKWRDKVRSHSLEIHRAAARGNRRQIIAERAALTALLNPFDSEDQAILTCADRVAYSDESRVCLQEFSDRIAYLLKHDWERAKYEAKWWSDPCELPRRQKYPRAVDKREA